MRFASSVSAAATLARIMKSSISRCASNRSRKSTDSTLPSSLSTIAAFGQVEVQGLAQVAGAVRGAPGGPERGDDGFDQRGGLRVGAAVGRRLGLGVGERGGRAHQAAGEAVRALVAVRVEGDAHGDTGAVGAFDQRAEIAGQRLGQHRHDAVGEVGGIAAAARLAVERGAGADVSARRRRWRPRRRGRRGWPGRRRGGRRPRRRGRGRRRGRW